MNAAATVTSSGPGFDWLSTCIGRCKCGKVEAVDDFGARVEWTKDCACGRKMKFTRVSGSVDSSHVCDSRCMGAKGHSCECSCGGKNHGRGWVR